MGRLALPYLGNGNGKSNGQDRGNSTSGHSNGESTRHTPFPGDAPDEVLAAPTTTTNAVVDAALDSLGACSNIAQGSNPLSNKRSSTNGCAGAEMQVADSLDESTWIHRSSNAAAATSSPSAVEQQPATHLPYESAPGVSNTSVNNTYDNSYGSSGNSSNYNEGLDLLPRSATAPDAVNVHATWMANWGSNVPLERYWTTSTGLHRQTANHCHHRHHFNNDDSTDHNHVTTSAFDAESNESHVNQAANAVTIAGDTTAADTAGASNSPLGEKAKAQPDDTFLDLLPISDNASPKGNQYSSSSSMKPPPSLSVHSPPNDASRRKVLDAVDLLPLPSDNGGEDCRSIANTASSSRGYTCHAVHNRSSTNSEICRKPSNTGSELPCNPTRSTSNDIRNEAHFTPPQSLPREELAPLRDYVNADSLNYTTTNSSSGSCRRTPASIRKPTVEGSLAKKMLSDARRQARGAHVLPHAMLATPPRPQDTSAAAGICFSSHSKVLKNEGNDDNDSMGSLSADESIDSHDLDDSDKNRTGQEEAAATATAAASALTERAAPLGDVEDVKIDEAEIALEGHTEVDVAEGDKKDNDDNDEGTGGAFEEPSPPWYLRAPGGGWAETDDPWPWPWPRPPPDAKQSSNAALLAKVKAKKMSQVHRPVPLRSPSKMPTRAPSVS